MVGYQDHGAHSFTVGAIGERIVSGHLLPNASLDVSELGEEFGVSRTVVREALRVLAAKGLVGAKPRRGTFVRPRTDWMLLDPDVLQWRFSSRADAAFLDQLFELRLTIEPTVAALAARRRTDEDLKQLAWALAAMRTTFRVHTGEHVEADVTFHRCLTQAAHNELFDQMSPVIETGLRVRDKLVHNLIDNDPCDRHEAVMVAIQRGDAESAATAMRLLLDVAASDVASVIDQLGVQQPSEFRVRARVPMTPAGTLSS